MSASRAQVGLVETNEMVFRFYDENRRGLLILPLRNRMPGHDSKTDIEFDFSRRERLGFPEIVYGEAKSIDPTSAYHRSMPGANHPVLISRCQPEKP